MHIYTYAPSLPAAEVLQVKAVMDFHRVLCTDFTVTSQAGTASLSREPAGSGAVPQHTP